MSIYTPQNYILFQLEGMIALFLLVGKWFKVLSPGLKNIGFYSGRSPWLSLEQVFGKVRWAMSIFCVILLCRKVVNPIKFDACEFTLQP